MTGGPGPEGVVELVAERMVAGGDALARDGSGRVVFLAGALPGERVNARLTDIRRDFARATVVDVLDASPDRVVPPCPAVAAGCGGCQWQHIAPDAQARFKAGVVRDALSRLGRIVDPPVDDTIVLPARGYRTTARFGVDATGHLGFRRFHGHDLVDPSACLVVHPAIAEMMAASRFPGADEVTLRVGARTGERLAFVDRRARHVTAPDGVVIADRRHDGHYHEEVAGRRWRISARSFFQVRPDGADTIAGIVADRAGPGNGRDAYDLYAGVGLFAGVLAGLGWAVTAVESSAAAVADARHNLGGATVIRAAVADFRPRPVTLVVADPGRDGLGRGGAAVVAGANPETVVLVSCDPAALGRDARLLAGAGYTLIRSTPVDLFPHTFHIEVVSEFRRP